MSSSRCDSRRSLRRFPSNTESRCGPARSGASRKIADAQSCTGLGQINAVRCEHSPCMSRWCSITSNFDRFSSRPTFPPLSQGEESPSKGVSSFHPRQRHLGSREPAVSTERTNSSSSLNARQKQSGPIEYHLFNSFR
jgi:hypothetical protein